jgi:hypothetical protein
MIMGAHYEAVIVERRVTGPQDSQPNEFAVASREPRPAQLAGLMWGKP